jgi:hypothetical protein
MTGITQGIKSPRKIKPNDAEPVSTVGRYVLAFSVDDVIASL